MLHIIKGKDIYRDTTTLCGELLENLPRKDASVPYSLRNKSDCPGCCQKASRIEAMRAGLKSLPKLDRERES